MPIHLKTYIMEGGERYALLQDDEGMPMFYPTLYVTTQVRNASLSTATEEQHLVAIKILLDCCGRSKIDLQERILTKRFLDAGELDLVRDACQKRQRSPGHKVISLKKGYTPPIPKVKSETTHIHLTRIASYLQWLCKTYLSDTRFTKETSSEIDYFVKEIRARRPFIPGRNVDDEAQRGLTDEQEQRLFEVMQPSHPENPFSDPSVRVRNYLILKLLRLLGSRGGELFNVQIGDFNWANNQLSIIRRADTGEDSRTRQPRVKTRQRIVPVAPSTMDEIRFYIVEVRKLIPNAAMNRYLLVTHKSGPTQGRPLSLSSLQEIFNVIATAHPELEGINAHDLRHRWNDVYSEEMDKAKHPHAEIEQWRNFLEGWVPGSKEGQHYAARQIRRKAHEASLTAQECFEQRVHALRNKRSTGQSS